MGMQSVPTKPLGDNQECDGCKARLSRFMGIHYIKKTKGRKIVCGMCIQSFLWDGWKEYRASETNE